jgi:hypothetical protein
MYILSDPISGMLLRTLFFCVYAFVTTKQFYQFVADIVITKKKIDKNKLLLSTFVERVTPIHSSTAVTVCRAYCN